MRLGVRADAAVLPAPERLASFERELAALSAPRRRAA